MLANSLRMLIRRWPLVILAVAIGIGVGGGAFASFPPTQQATASVLLVPSVEQPGVEGPTNPLLSLGGSVAVVASVVQIAVSDDQTGLDLIAQGHTAKYEVAPDLSENAGPLLLITTESTSAENAKNTRDAVVAKIADRLRELQDSRNVPAQLRITSVVLTSSPTVEPIQKRRIQIAVGGAALAVVMMVMIIILIERRAMGHRESSRRAKDALTSAGLSEPNRTSAGEPRPSASAARPVQTTTTNEQGESEFVPDRDRGEHW